MHVSFYPVLLLAFREFECHVCLDFQEAQTANELYISGAVFGVGDSDRNRHESEIKSSILLVGAGSIVVRNWLLSAEGSSKQRKGRHWSDHSHLINIY